MSRRILILTSFVLVSGFESGNADTLRLKIGAKVQGTLISANSNEVRFDGADSGPKTYALSDVEGIDFAPLSSAPQAAAPKNANADKARAATAGVVVPAGTEITVRTIDTIQGSASGAGQRYSASIDDPVVVNNEVVIPRGANCSVEVVKLESGEEVDVKLYDVSIGGKSYATATEYAVVKAQGTSKSRKAMRRGIGLGALGAGIGALAGGGEAAAIGAAVGGGVGAVSASTAKGKQINIPAETTLSFKLKSPLPLN